MMETNHFQKTLEQIRPHHKILFYWDHYRSQTTELLFRKMPNFTTNQKFLENFVLIFAKDNTDCFLFCNLGSTLLKREDLLKFSYPDEPLNTFQGHK